MVGFFLLTTQLDKDTRISLNILSGFQNPRGFIGIVTTTIRPLDSNCVYHINTEHIHGAFPLPLSVSHDTWLCCIDLNVWSDLLHLLRAYSIDLQPNRPLMV